MTKKSKAEKRLKEQAVSIAAEIFNLINQYTNDSALSKFFLPDEISTSFYVAAGGFASVVYTPQLEAEEIRDTQILSFFLILITYGFQIYLKEYSIRTNAAPYRLPTDLKRIEIASLEVLRKAEEGDLISTPLSDEIINITIKQMEPTYSLSDFQLDKHLLNEDKLRQYTTLILYYGYNMAARLLNKR